MVDLLGALDLGRLVRKVVVDSKRKVEGPAPVHAYPSLSVPTTAAAAGAPHLRPARS